MSLIDACLRTQIARLLPYVPDKHEANFCLRRLGWLDTADLVEVLEWFEDYFLAIHEAVDPTARGASKSQRAYKMLKEGTKYDWIQIRRIFKNAQKPKK